MDIKHVILSTLPAKLAHRLQKGQTLDIPYGSAHLADQDVIAFCGSADAPLDLVGDMGNYLYRSPQVVAATLIGNHGFIDLPGGAIVLPTHRRRDIALVMSQVEIGFRAVVGDKDLAMLVRAHRPRIDVDIRIHLEQGNLQTPALQERSDGGGGQAFAQGGYHPSGHEDEFSFHSCHLIFFSLHSENCPEISGTVRPFSSLLEYLLPRTALPRRRLGCGNRGPRREAAPALRSAPAVMAGDAKISRESRADRRKPLCGGNPKLFAPANQSRPKSGERTPHALGCKG